MNLQTLDEPKENAAPAPVEGDLLPIPSWRLVIALSVPVLAQQGLSFLVLLSDRYLAGHITTLPPQEQLAVQAAQTTTHYLAWFINCYNVLVTVGSTALVAQFIGAGNRELAVKVTHQSLLLAVFLGLLATAWAFLGGVRWMVERLELQGQAADYATEYLLTLFSLIVFQTVEVAGVACLIGAGDTRTGLWVMIGIAVINIPLAWAFSRGLGPFPQMGFAGIAVGTALSYTLGGLVIVAILARGRFGLKLAMRLFWPRFDLLYRLLRISVPVGLDNLSLVAGQLWFLTIINRISLDAAGAHGIALSWEALGYLSGQAFGTAAMTLVGQNLGAEAPEQATRAGWMAFALGCGVMTLMGAIFYSFAPLMFELFCPRQEQAKIIELGVPVLRLVAFAMPILASSIVFTYALRGAGDTRVPVLFTWVGFFAVRIPLAYFLAQPSVKLYYFGSVPGLDWGLYGCWLAMFADLVVRGIFFLVRFARGAWQKQKV